ncbi:redoxin domain-containing protein [Haloplanus aerogenes]|uniref:Peroxiredoxin n=1 Tax=Haloplanus aerogenes TaxID=660522 RepID=A0A3M0CY63_9EURY|nr:redoxin domain-containing protein [Haloplanus aerogenes]AZH24979.1 peroxiredoxin [Haloplanus aerogenes]RMB13804.1 peroxiredoxin [Haloplanus aerogenes]
MVDIGDEAPDFTAPLANGDVEAFTLSDHLDEAPIVLAFFPAAFTNTCTTEMCTFRDRLSRFEDVGGTVYGVSVDLPYTLNEFRRQNDLNFGLISDERRDLIDAYGVGESWEPREIRVAKRAVFVVDGDGRITYRWIADNPKQEPDYDAVREAAADASA